MIHMLQMSMLCFRGVSLEACNVRATFVSAHNIDASCRVDVTVITPRPHRYLTLQVSLRHSLRRDNSALNDHSILRKTTLRSRKSNVKRRWRPVIRRTSTKYKRRSFPPSHCQSRWRSSTLFRDITSLFFSISSQVRQLSNTSSYFEKKSHATNCDIISPQSLK